MTAPGRSIAHFTQLDRFVMGRFKGRAHHYLTHVPESDEDIEWRALARHHSAPSRLLDWTKSPYVAAYFAAADADAGAEAAIWALDIEKVESLARKKLVAQRPDIFKHLEYGPLSSKKNFQLIFGAEWPSYKVLIPVTPSRINERMAAQQGLFFMAHSGTVEGGFESDLKHMLVFAQDEGTDTTGWLYKLRILPTPSGVPPSVGSPAVFAGISNKQTLLRELNKMNINHASLQPGLDGFARSLEVQAQIFHPAELQSI